MTDYLTKEGHSKEELDELIAASENQNAPWVFMDGDGVGVRAKVRINGDILADSISRGLPYLIVRRPEEDKDDFYLYEDGVYNKFNNVYNLLLCKDSNICTFRDFRKLEPHTPKLRSTIQLNCEYHPEDTARPVFDRYMDDLCSDREGRPGEEGRDPGVYGAGSKVHRVKQALVLWPLLGNSGKT